MIPSAVTKKASGLVETLARRKIGLADHQTGIVPESGASIPAEMKKSI